jgi:hypothetical protein
MKLQGFADVTFIEVHINEDESALEKLLKDAYTASTGLRASVLVLPGLGANGLRFFGGAKKGEAPDSARLSHSWKVQE